MTISNRCTEARARTPRECVQEKHPGAFTFKGNGPYWLIFPSNGYLLEHAIGHGTTRIQAWADAAKNLRKP